MTPDETVILARYVRALCPQQKFDEYTPDAWHDVLRDLTLDDCRQACATIARNQPFIAPAEIAAEVRHVRDQRLGDTPPAYEPPRDDETGAQYVARRRAQLKAIADGRLERMPIGELTGGPAPEVAARLKALGRYIPDDVRQQLAPHRPAAAAREAAIRAGHPDYLSVRCTWCDAPEGERCRSRRVVPGAGATSNRPRTTPHPSRIEAAEAAMNQQEAS